MIQKWRDGRLCQTKDFHLFSLFQRTVYKNVINKDGRVITSTCWFIHGRPEGSNTNKKENTNLKKENTNLKKENTNKRRKHTLKKENTNLRKRKSEK